MHIGGQLFQIKLHVLFVVFFLGVSHCCLATTYTVGQGNSNPTPDYPTPNALYQANMVQQGDTILIEVGTYSGNDALAAWNADDLFIQGVNGRPHLVANGQYILEKGIWVLVGDNIIIENIEFSEACVPDKNGAGIRVDGSGFTVRYCYFHDNENGILATPSSTGIETIEYFEFANNGFGDGFGHNLYINDAERFIFKYNYSHHAFIGHFLKSRARENIIQYNRIMDGDTGQSSRLIDLSKGGFSIILGNILMQGPQAVNNNLIGYGLEGLVNGVSHELYVINNTEPTQETHKIKKVSFGAIFTFLN